MPVFFGARPMGSRITLLDLCTFDGAALPLQEVRPLLLRCAQEQKPSRLPLFARCAAVCTFQRRDKVGRRLLEVTIRDALLLVIGSLSCIAVSL